MSLSHSSTITSLLAAAALAGEYRKLRQQNPAQPARLVVDYIKHGEAMSFVQFACERQGGHDWRITGSAYGGDDDRYRGEGRSYCAHCGLDGDA